MQNIALTGLARSGKDSVAARLVEAHGYARVAFADRLKDAALKADPVIPYDLPGFGGLNHVRLSTLVEHVGWERAKDEYPEVRRFLQYYGQTVREIDTQFWIKAARPAVVSAWEHGQPVVVTDVRYVNEAQTLRRNGFTIVRVLRPGQTPGEHVSEREMLTYPADVTIVNDDTLSTLAVKADELTYA
jgi:hypothetical protein